MLGAALVLVLRAVLLFGPAAGLTAGLSIGLAARLAEWFVVWLTRGPYRVPRSLHHGSRRTTVGSAIVLRGR